MPTGSWDHVHSHTPDPEPMTKWFADIRGGEIIRRIGRTDVKLSVELSERDQEYK